MKYFWILLLIGIVTIIGFSISGASACLCDGLTIEQKIDQADVIFSGTAYENPWNFSKDKVAAGFSVNVVWKGADSFTLIKTGHVPVVTTKVSTACGINLIKDKEYLIYAKVVDNNLQTTTCDGSWFLDGKGDDIKALGAIGTTHHFIDAREIKGSSSDDCRGPGLFTFEQCEFEKLVRNVFLPVGIALPDCRWNCVFSLEKKKMKTRILIVVSIVVVGMFFFSLFYIPAYLKCQSFEGNLLGFDICMLQEEK